MFKPWQGVAHGVHGGQAGVKQVVLTLGAAGAAWCSFPSALDSFTLREAVPGRLSHSSPAAGHQTSPRRRQEMAVLHIPALPAQIKSLIGAGDSLVAGCMDALLRGLDPSRALAFGAVNATPPPPPHHGTVLLC